MHYLTYDLYDLRRKPYIIIHYHTLLTTYGVSGVDRFEPPTHAEQVGLAVQHLNHSATSYFR